MVTVVDKYRGVEILREEPTARGAASVGAELAQPIVRFHAFPNGIRVAAQSIEAVKQLIDDTLDAPPDPPAK